MPRRDQVPRHRQTHLANPKKSNPHELILVETPAPPRLTTQLHTLQKISARATNTRQGTSSLVPKKQHASAAGLQPLRNESKESLDGTSRQGTSSLVPQTIQDELGL
jgi:hypothetical protein